MFSILSSFLLSQANAAGGYFELFGKEARAARAKSNNGRVAPKICQDHQEAVEGFLAALAGDGSGKIDGELAASFFTEDATLWNANAEGGPDFGAVAGSADFWGSVQPHEHVDREFDCGND